MFTLNICEKDFILWLNVKGVLSALKKWLWTFMAWNIASFKTRRMFRTLIVSRSYSFNGRLIGKISRTGLRTFLRIVSAWLFISFKSWVVNETKLPFFPDQTWAQKHPQENEHKAKSQKKNKSWESRHFKQVEESTYYRLNRFSLKGNTHIMQL